MLGSILGAVEKARDFGARLAEFMGDVVRCGLHNQYESVCENIGLMAFLLQTEPHAGGSGGASAGAGTGASNSGAAPDATATVQ